MRWLHRYAKLLVAATLLLVTAGGMVTSTGSGLAVPDWPTTYGENLFTFPLSKMVGGLKEDPRRWYETNNLTQPDEEKQKNANSSNRQ